MKNFLQLALDKYKETDALEQYSFIQKHKIDFYEKKVERVIVYKELIDFLISLDTKNRIKRPKHIKFLAELIRDGKWMLTNQGIGVSVDGVLIDGGHRLQAIKQEGYPPVEIMIAWGLSNDAALCVDQGLTRSISDSLLFEDNINTTSRAIAMIRAAMIHAGDKAQIIKKLGRITQERRTNLFEVRKALTLCKKEIDDILNIHGVCSKLNATMKGAIFTSYYETKSTRILDFAALLCKGEGLFKGDPVYYVWNLMQDKSKQGYTANHILFNKILIAIDRFCAGEKLYHIQNKK